MDDSVSGESSIGIFGNHSFDDASSFSLPGISIPIDATESFEDLTLPALPGTAVLQASSPAHDELSATDDTSPDELPAAEDAPPHDPPDAEDVPPHDPTQTPFEWLIGKFERMFDHNKVVFPDRNIFREREMLWLVGTTVCPIQTADSTLRNPFMPRREPFIIPKTMDVHLAIHALRLAINESNLESGETPLHIGVEKQEQEKKRKAPYMCKKCGKPKNNHTCEPPKIETQTNVAGIKTVLSEGFKNTSPSGETYREMKVGKYVEYDDLKREATATGCNKPASSRPKKKARESKYMCSKCGKPKKGHKCLLPRMGIQTDVTSLPAIEERRHVWYLHPRKK